MVVRMWVKSHNEFQQIPRYKWVNLLLKVPQFTPCEKYGIEAELSSSPTQQKFLLICLTKIKRNALISSWTYHSLCHKGKENFRRSVGIQARNTVHSVKNISVTNCTSRNQPLATPNRTVNFLLYLSFKVLQNVPVLSPG